MKMDEDRHVSGSAIGVRSAAPCQRLRNAIPPTYRAGMGSTDFWQTYAPVLPDDPHEAGGNETGQTAHGERRNNTLRHTVGALCPRKSRVFHILEHA